MSDPTLAGSRNVGSVTPVQLYAGEKQVVTGQTILAGGHSFGLIDGTTNRPFAFAAVMASTNPGEVEPWDGVGAIVGVVPHVVSTAGGAVPSPIIHEAVLNVDALCGDATYNGQQPQLIDFDGLLPGGLHVRTLVPRSPRPASVLDASGTAVPQA